jgi:1-acyl-sn-glycerol-3-phosphate acyltransferase
VDLVAGTAQFLGQVKKIGVALTEFQGDSAVRARIDRLDANLGPYGVDPFGFDPQYLKGIAGIGVWFYRHYFRCALQGIQYIPKGRCLVVANHSGQLPYDAAMINVGVFLESEPPRFLRSMVERFVPTTPFVSVFLARCGQILGTPENCRRLLAAEEPILVFPEGVGGLNKTWKDRYKLQSFGQGFMRLAIETTTPIVPCALIGAEEQAPSFFNAKLLGRLFGLPSFPITPAPLFGLVPLPTKYHIHFGPPMLFEGNANDEDQVILRKVDQVRSTIQGLLDDGLKARRGVFF